MRALAVMLVVCLGLSVARAEPPEPRAAARVAERWYAAVQRGDARRAAALTALPVVFGFDAGGPAPPAQVTSPTTRRELRAAIARWRAALEVFPARVPSWRDEVAGDDWREVGFGTSDESFGELHVRVAHGRVIAIRGFWSWGGH